MNRAAFVVLLVWVVTAPVLLGSVPEVELSDPGGFGRFLAAGGGYALFTVLGLCALILVVSSLKSQRGAPLAPDRSAKLLLLLLVLVPIFGLVQLVPLPRFLHALFAPGHAADLDLLLPGSGAAPISVDPDLTWQAVLRGFLLFAAAFVTVQTARSGWRAFLLLGSLAGIAALAAAYGILETYALGDRVLGFGKIGTGTGVTGTFIYRGNFTAFTAAGLGVAVALVVAAFRARRPLYAGLSTMAVVLLASGILLSGSRAGLLAAGAAGAAGLFLCTRSRILKLVITGGAIAAVLGAAIFVGSVRERFQYLGGDGRSFADIRIPAWTSALELAKGRPVFGAGLGTFRRAIHLTQSDLVPDELFYAHSDPVNLLSEGGAVLLAIGLAAALVGILGALRMSRNPGGGGIGAACGGGLAGLLTMALVDFPLQIPATSLAATVLLLLPAAGRWGEPRPETPVSRGVRIGDRVALVVFLGAVLILAGARVRGALDLPGGITRQNADAVEGAHLLGERKAAQALEVLTAAKERHPFDGPVRYYLARALFTKGKFDQAGLELAAARHLAHGNGDLLFRIGSMAYRMQLPFFADALKEAGALEPRHFTTALGSLPAEVVPEIVPERAFAYGRLGAWHRTRGEYDQAIAAFWRAHELGGGDLEALAKLYLLVGREGEGREEFGSRSVPWPDSAD